MTPTNKPHWDITGISKWDYTDPPRGALIPTGGNAGVYQTGTWRAERPIWDEEKCTDCMICWNYCPDASILVTDEKMKGIDFFHCKGCGICAVECPFDALKMVPEHSSEGEAKNA